MADVTALHPMRPASHEPEPQPHRDPPRDPYRPHGTYDAHTSAPAREHGAGHAPHGTAPARPGEAGDPRPAPGAPHAGAGADGAPDLTGDEAPLPRRVRQASLVDELRVDPAAGAALPRPPRWQDDPLLRPVPRRAGATIGAFQRRSRAAREGRTPTPPEPTAPRQVMREEERS